jgi:hypothetical protein
MNFTPNSDTFRTTDISGAINIPDPIGFTIDEAFGYVKSRPGDRISPATAYDSYDLAVTGRGAKPFTPATRASATPASISITVLEIGQGSATFSIDTMLPGAFKANGNAKPHEFEQSAEFSAGDTENIDPISVS